MQYLPLSLDIKNQRCLVVGGGAIAQRKITLIARAGAEVDVVSPEILDEVVSLCEQSGGKVYQQSFDESFLQGKRLVIAATDSAAVNEQVANAARALGVLVNVVDTPALSDVIFPAIIDRSPLTISVSSSGAAPVLARSVRSSIESTIPANFGALADFIGERRTKVREQLDEQRLRLFWEDVVESEIAESVMSGRIEHATGLFDQALSVAVENKDASQGEVYLIGAGPGDPDLMTFKALRLLQRADVVLHDRLVAPEIVDMARRDAERVYVGKARSDHAVPQRTINEMLLYYAKQGRKVARLKGGDPFVFGRGGEEITGLASQNIPFQVVPGISAANGCACYAGIPLTHRDHAQSVRFITGHLKDGDLDLPWQEFISKNQTIVFYMGLVSLPAICQQLIVHGRAANTECALVEQGTTFKQRVHVATLATIAELVDQENVRAPTLLIIGSVVSLHDELKWR